MQPRFKHFRVVFLGVVVVAVTAAAVMAFSESSRRDPVCNGIRPHLLAIEVRACNQATSGLFGQTTWLTLRGSNLTTVRGSFHTRPST